MGHRIVRTREVFADHRSKRRRYESRFGYPSSFAAEACWWLGSLMPACRSESIPAGSAIFVEAPSRFLLLGVTRTVGYWRATNATLGLGVLRVSDTLTDHRPS